MNRILLVINCIAFMLLVTFTGYGQSNQTVNDGVITRGISFSDSEYSYKWANDDPEIELPVRDTGDSICPSCIFTITGSSKLVKQPTITSTTLTGSIATCVGTASVSPNIGRFLVSATDLISGIVATATAGFEISLNGITFSSSLNIPQADGVINAVPVYVRASSSAPVGDIAGNVQLSSGDVSQSVLLTGTINDLPTVDPMVSQQKVAGQLTDLIHFTGKGNRYIWTNDTPGIGLYGTGVGDIPPFTAVNNTTSPIKATVTVMPSAPAYAYIANAIDGTVSVTYTSTGTTAATIPVGKAPFGISASSDGSRIYVVNKGSDDVSVISTATNKEISRIPVGRSPYCDAVSPDGSRLFVTNYLDNSISVINTAINKVINTIPVANSPYAIRISPDGALIYVTSEDPAALSVINALTGALVKYLPFQNENNVFGLTVSHDGKSIYVAGAVSNSKNGNISVINALTNNVVYNITVDAGPAGICISPDNKRIYVACQTAGTIMSVSTLTNKTVTRISNLDNPFGVSVTPDGGQLYVTGGLHSTTVISTLTSKVTSQVSAGTGTDSFGNFIPNISGCSGNAVQFTITVDPAPIPVITVSGALDTLKTVYGTASASTVFTVSGTYIAHGILIIPPPGYEVSTDNLHFGAAVTIENMGTVAPTAVWLRLAATTPAGLYQGAVVTVSGNAKNISLTINSGEVSPAPLLITADDKNKMLGTYNPELTASCKGFQNGDGPEQLIVQPVVTTTAVQNSPLGEYPISVGGAVSNNYTISYIAGVLSIIPVKLLVIPNTFTPNGDGINDTWEIKSLLPYPNCTVYIYNRRGENVYSSIGYGVAWDGRYKGRALPFGTYYYIINPRDGLLATAGYVAIIR